MKLIDMLLNVSKTQENEMDCYSGVEWLLDARNIPNYHNLDYDTLQKQNRLKFYWLTQWLCTDTWVGSVVVYLDGQPTGLISKDTRKSDATGQFVSSELKKRVKSYLLELFFQDEEEPDSDIIPEVELLTEDYSTHYKVSYPSQIIAKEAELDTGTDDGPFMVEIPRLGQDHSWNNFTDVLVKVKATGEEKKVKIHDLYFKKHVNQAEAVAQKLISDTSHHDSKVRYSQSNSNSNPYAKNSSFNDFLEKRLAEASNNPKIGLDIMESCGIINKAGEITRDFGGNVDGFCTEESDPDNYKLGYSILKEVEMEEPEEFRLTGKEVWKAACPEHEKQLDEALGLIEIKLKIPTAVFGALESEAKQEGIITKALIREILVKHAVALILSKTPVISIHTSGGSRYSE